MRNLIIILAIVTSCLAALKATSDNLTDVSESNVEYFEDKLLKLNVKLNNRALSLVAFCVL